MLGEKRPTYMHVYIVEYTTKERKNEKTEYMINGSSARNSHFSNRYCLTLAIMHEGPNPSNTACYICLYTFILSFALPLNAIIISVYIVQITHAEVQVVIQ